MTGDAFMLNPDADTLRPLLPREFRGLYGHKEPERPLQELIEKHPELIPGDQIALGSADSPRFVMLGDEAHRIDVLLADQHGVLTIVETKMRENPQSRREVVGQVLEYAANVRSAWDAGTIREAAARYWTRHNKEVNQVIRETFGADIDVEEFWQAIQRNIQEGKIRILIVGDSIAPEVRRTIEYLNLEMQNTEFLGVEITCYGSEETGEVLLVPRMIGQTQDAADRKSRPSGAWREPWTREEFLATTEQRGIAENKKNLVRSFLEMAHQLSQEQVVGLRWGTGAIDGTVTITCGKARLLYINVRGETFANLATWNVPAEQFELLRRELGKLLHMELRGKYPMINKALLEHDPELRGLENWIRFAVKTTRGEET